ncbi:MAG: hypothetical protein Q9168_004503 [Polycauliona sp. 1 TL-2023]
MDGRDSIVVYRIIKSPGSRSWPALLKSLGKLNSSVRPIALLANSDCVILLSDGRSPSDQQEMEVDSVRLHLLACIKWHDVLLFLHPSSKLPKVENQKEGLLKVLQIMVDQKCPRVNPDEKSSIHDSEIARARLKPMLEIQFEPRRIRQTSLVKTMESIGLNDLQSLEQHVTGLRVEVHQSKDSKGEDIKNKTSIITGLSHPKDSQDTKRRFAVKVAKYGGGSQDVEFYHKPTDKYITVFDYFNKYKQQLDHHPELPLINIGTATKPTYIPPSCCELSKQVKPDPLVVSVGYIMQKINEQGNIPKIMSDDINSNGIQSSSLRLPPADELQNCRITMTASTVNQCRSKMAPSLEYPSKKIISPSYGTWSMRQTGMDCNNSKSTCKVAVLVIGCSRLIGTEQLVKTLIALHDRSKHFGIELSNRDSPQHCDMPNGKFIQEVKEDIRIKISDLVKDKINDAVLIMLPLESKAIYEYVKRLCDVALGVHNVVIDTHKLGAAVSDNGYGFQTALKLNAKTGDQNQTLMSSPSDSIDINKTMIVGIDVIVPSVTTKGKSKAIILMISSTDTGLTQWPAAVHIQDDKTTLEQSLSDLLRKQIKLRKEKHKGATPANILIYYKGLSDTYPATGLESLQDRFNGVTVTVIAVNKDHHTKLETLSSVDKEEKDKTIPVGSLITRTRDGKEKWEFLIQGHQPKHIDEKTKPPTTLEASAATLAVRYTVVQNTLYVNAEAKIKLENLTHDMQYLFASSTAAISDTLPIHYVGLLRKRIELYLKTGRPKRDGQKRSDKEAGTLEDQTPRELPQVHSNIAHSMFYL